MRMSRIAALVLAASLSGCLPDLDQWEIGGEDTDSGPSPDQDGGPTQQPNPIQLGRPCPNPHLMLGSIASSSSIGRVLRVDPTDGTRCRDSALLESQLAHGSSVLDVDWHPATGPLLGLSNAVLGLDAEGFPRWRHQDFNRGTFEGEWVAAFGQGAALRIAVAWSARSTSLDSMVLLSPDGIPTSGSIDPPFFGMAIAPHPDGSARLLIPSRAGALIEVYDVNDATTRLTDTNSTPLWSSGASLVTTYGNRAHLASDVASGRLVITHERGVAFWQLEDAAPDIAYACPDVCQRFHAAALDPGATDEAYAICVATSSSTRHLVRVGRSGCALVIDGTSMSGQTLQDVTLVRAAL